MFTLVPLMLVTIQIGSIVHSTMYVYSAGMVWIEYDISKTFGGSHAVEGALFDLSLNTVTYYGYGLTKSYQDEIKTLPNVKIAWDVAPSIESSANVEIRGLVTEEDMTCLHVSSVDTQSYCYDGDPVENHFLLFDLELQADEANALGFIRHNFNLPNQYRNYKYILKQWQTYLMDDEGEEFSIIQTKITRHQAPPYPLDSLTKIPILTKEEFYQRAPSVDRKN